MRERRTQQKKQKQRHYFSSKYPLICISIFRSLRCGLTMTLLLWARATRDTLAVRSHPPESVLKSGPSSLNHHHQKVNTAHESITWGGELKARHPRVSLIQTTNLSDSQIIGNLLDSVEKEIFTLIIHSVRGCISSPLCYKKKWDHTGAQSRRQNAMLEWKWTSLAVLPHSLLPCLFSPLICFSNIFFPLSQPPSSYSFWLAGDSNPVPFLLLLYCHKHSASHTLSKPTMPLRIKSGWQPRVYFLTFISKIYFSLNDR